MAKQAKMKKGSIGKKALAAILAASMVLSSSAFSVLASVSAPDDGDVTVPDAEVAPASLNEDNGIAPVALTGDHHILLGFRDPDTGVPLSSCRQDIVYDSKAKTPEVVVVDCNNPNHTDIRDCYDANGYKLDATEDCTCKELDKTKHYYTVEYGNNTNAAAGLNCDKEDGSNQGAGSAARAEFAAAGPYACVNFSNNQMQGGGENPYANLGSYFISFKIKPINLDDVQVAITNLQYNHTYKGQKTYPGMNSVVLTLNGQEIKLEEGKDYVAEPYGDCDDLISASDLKNGNTNDPIKDKRVVLRGITSVDLDGDGKPEKGNYEGTLGDQKYNGNMKNNDTPGYAGASGTEALYPSEELKVNDNEIVYHINQKTNNNDIKIAENIVINRKVGDTDSVTRDGFIAMLNGTLNGKGLAGAGAKVTDSLRSETDPEYYMTCDDGTNPTEADYTVEFLQANNVWGDTPDARTGEHSFRITTTGEEDYVKNSVIYGSYTVTNPGRLQRAVEDYCSIDQDGTGAAEAKELTNGALTIPYDGVDHYPSKWDATTIQVGTNEDDSDGNTHNTALQYGVDYTVTSVKEEWKDAKTYELTLQGLGGISDETATISVRVTPRNINELSETAILDDVNDQHFADKGGSAGNNGTEITPATSPKTYNIENQKKADGTALGSGDKKSVVRVLAEQGVHTTSNTYSDVVVTITDAGLDSSVGNNGEVTLEEGVDYEVAVKERTDEATGKTIKYVEVEGINNYTTTLTANAKVVATVYQEDVDILKKMPLNSKQITASVEPAAYKIVQKGQKIQLTTDNIKLVETDTGHDPYNLTKDDFSIIRYEQDGKWISTSDGITKPGTAYVVVGPADNSSYINEVKIPFTVTSEDFKSAITIDQITDYQLAANKDGLAGTDLAEYLDGKIVVRYTADPTSTFSTGDYTVTVKNNETGEVVAYREYDNGELKWYTDAKKGTELKDATDLMPRGAYTILVESTDYRYEGIAEADFNIVGENIAAIGLSIAYTTSWDYTSKEIKPEVTVTKTADNIPLVADKDYTVAYDYNIDAGGNGRITLTGIGNYSGVITRTFTINKATGTVAVEAAQKAKLESGVNAGESEAVTLEVYLGEEKITDEKMTYSLSSSDTNVVAIAADGKTMNYVGNGTATITLTPSSTNVDAEAITFDVTVTGAVAEEPEAHLTTKHYSTKTKTIGLTTNKIAEATKWQVRYATNKDMTGKYTKTVKTPKRLYHLTLTVKKSKTKYYVRVRAYVNGKWTKWSEKESIKSR